MVCNGPALKLTLQALVTIDAELGRIGKEGAELDEKRSELFVQAVEIVEVYIGSAVIDPGDGAPSWPKASATSRAPGIDNVSNGSKSFLPYIVVFKY